MKQALSRQEFEFVKPEDKAFICAFDEAMGERGYVSGEIGNGYCWGRYMIIYTKAGVKSKKSYARVYIRDEDVVLRLYFSDVEKQRELIERAPAYVKDAFVGAFPRCDHCHGKTECIHQKRYVIDDVPCETCDGKAFWFFAPDVGRLPEYLLLFDAFYRQKARKVKVKP